MRRGSPSGASSRRGCATTVRRGNLRNRAGGYTKTITEHLPVKSTATSQMLSLFPGKTEDTLIGLIPSPRPSLSVAGRPSGEVRRSLETARPRQVLRHNAPSNPFLLPFYKYSRGGAALHLRHQRTSPLGHRSFRNAYAPE